MSEALERKIKEIKRLYRRAFKDELAKKRLDKQVEELKGLALTLGDIDSLNKILDAFKDIDNLPLEEETKINEFLKELEEL